MFEFIRMIQDDIVDKEQLILKRHEFLNIDKVQAQYIAKLFNNKDIVYYKLTLDDISNELSIPKEATEKLLKNLLKNGNITIKNEDNKLIFNFGPLINKLIESYITPSNKASVEEKLDWTLRTLSFDLTQNNIDELRMIIEENGWEVLSIVINKISTIDNADYNQLISMYESLGTKEKTDSRQLKEIMDFNWLEN